MKKTIAALSVVFTAAAAYLFAGHKHWHGLKIDHEVKPVDVATLAVNITIAFLIQYVFLERSSNIRVEKDLTIDDVKATIATVRESNDTFLRRFNSSIIVKQDWNLCVNQCKNISNSIEFLDVSFCSSTCKKCRGCGRNSETMKSLKNAFFEYKAAMTEDAAGTTPTSKSTTDQATSYRKLMRLLRELISEINKH